MPQHKSHSRTQRVREWGLPVFGTDRNVATTSASVFLNAFLGVGQLAFGIYSQSLWFVVNALYFLIICIARLVTLRGYGKVFKIKDRREKRTQRLLIYRRCGAFICLVGMSYLIVCLRMFFVGDAAISSGLAVYFVATVAFTKIGFAIQGIVVTRGTSDLVNAAIKRINLVDAVVSIVVTQCTLLTMESLPQAQSLSAAFGMAASIGFIALGIIMILKRGK